MMFYEKSENLDLKKTNKNIYFYILLMIEYFIIDCLLKINFQ